MNSSKVFLIFLLHLFIFVLLTQAAPSNSNLFREYIGAEGKNVKFTDVPINSDVEFHFILSFGIDYTFINPAPTNGRFNAFWDTDNLSPSQVSSIKSRHSNVRVAVSLGGDTVSSGFVYFQPFSINSWVRNAVVSLTKIIKEYNLDGIDIDYEHFHSDPNTFAECIGRLITTLKHKKVIKFASIAPFDNPEVQSNYQALWRKYSHVIDYVNFQFYAYDKGTTVLQFLEYFDTQTSNYIGGKIITSFSTDESGGLKPKNGFFRACQKLKSQGKLNGIFVWSADDSKKPGFPGEKQAQILLASPRCSVDSPVPCELPGQ